MFSDLQIFGQNGADDSEGEGIEVSFELFPPKTDALTADLKGVTDQLAMLSPSFFSVTYGAGGSTRERTHEVVLQVARTTGLPVAAHLTCVNASRAEVDEVASSFWASGIRHIVALRGDAGVPGAPFQAHPDGYRSAAELVEGLKRIAPFEISVAAYPEGHPDARNLAADLDNLWRKFDAGAERAITQFFFSADAFLRFRDQAAALGIEGEIVPGILPIANVAQTRHFAAQCGATIPPSVDRMIEGLDERPTIRALVSAALTAQLCMQLRAGGVRNFHFFTLNRADLSQAVCHLLGIRPKEEVRAQNYAA